MAIGQQPALVSVDPVAGLRPSPVTPSDGPVVSGQGGQGAGGQQAAPCCWPDRGVGQSGVGVVSPLFPMNDPPCRPSPSL